MALTKQQAYPLYFLLTTESQLVMDLRGCAFQDGPSFVAALQGLVDKIAPGLTLDAQLEQLYTLNPNPASSRFSQDPKVVLNAVPVLNGLYGGGPCPKPHEQPVVWNALASIVV